jgi:hypothetical protein
MLNSYSRGGNVSVNSSININAISGTIVKNHRKSFIIDYHLDNTLGKKLMTSDPKISKHTGRSSYNSGYEEIPVVILQTMVCGDLRVISEIMWQDDFDKAFE